MFDCPWHVHPEVEILSIDAGTGRRLVGDAQGHYATGDLYLFGPNLPHLFHSDPPIPDASSHVSKSRYVQFRMDCFGSDFFKQKELRRVQSLLVSAGRGLYFGSQSGESTRRLAETFESEGAQRVASLVSLLGHLATLPARTLAGASFESATGSPEVQKLGRAIDYIHRHMTDDLDLARVAHLVRLSPGGFSRAFRNQHGRSFTDFVLDLRLGEACRLLLETDLPIVDVCYSSGFANLSNFNRQFLKRRGTTPRQFRRAILPSNDNVFAG